MTINNKVKSDKREVYCDGNNIEFTNQSNSHPKVYLYIKDKEVTCPYCSTIFTLE